MACEFCGFEFGKVIRCAKSNFPCCGTVYDDIMLVKYVGFDGAFHVFRLITPVRCPSCGELGTHLTFPCADFKDGLFLRESEEVSYTKENSV